MWKADMVQEEIQVGMVGVGGVRGMWIHEIMYHIFESVFGSLRISAFMGELESECGTGCSTEEWIRDQ